MPQEDVVAGQLYSFPYLDFQSCRPAPRGGAKTGRATENRPPPTRSAPFGPELILLSG